MKNKKYEYLTDEEIKVLKEKCPDHYSPSYELLEVFETNHPTLGKIKVEKLKSSLWSIKYDIHSIRKYL